MIAVFAFLFLAGPPAEGSWRWLAWAAILGPGIPSLYAVVAFVSGRVTSVFIPNGRQRVAPMLLASVSCSLGTWYLLKHGSPDYAAQLMAGYTCVALGAAFGSWWWAISLHVAGVAAPLVVGMVAVDLWYMVLFPIPIVVGWARVRRGEHTVAQVVVGGLLGVGSIFLGNILIVILGI